MNTQTLRERFEKKHPYPLSSTWNIYVRFIDGKYVYVANEDCFWEDDKNLVADYQKLWEGYQSGAEDNQCVVDLSGLEGNNLAYVSDAVRHYVDNCLDECSRRIKASGARIKP